MFADRFTFRYWFIQQIRQADVEVLTPLGIRLLHAIGSVLQNCSFAVLQIVNSRKHSASDAHLNP